MMQDVDEGRDIMLVCDNGHVVTDRAREQPELLGSRCPRCGAGTLSRCQTCGTELPGAAGLPGLSTVGTREPPGFCSTCGAAFPWSKRLALPPGDLLPAVEKLLRRLPRTVRELRMQAGSRPPFRIEDERDLEYLLRAVLPLCCDDVRIHGRTPGYSHVNRSDFLLMPERFGVTAKLVTRTGAEPVLQEQLGEDLRYHEREKACRLLFVLVLDMQSLLTEPEHLEALWSGATEGLKWRCVVAR